MSPYHSVMAGFKKGAFSVAVKAGVDVVPVTLLGTGAASSAVRHEAYTTIVCSLIVFCVQHI